MKLNVSDEKMRELVKDVMIELIRDNREEFYDLILEAIEEAGLARAIKEGRKNKFVSEDRISKILDS